MLIAKHEGALSQEVTGHTETKISQSKRTESQRFRETMTLNYYIAIL